MRVRIAYTVDVSDDIRRAINDYYGVSGLADRATVHRWYEANGHSMDLDLLQADATDDTDPEDLE